MKYYYYPLCTKDFSLENIFATESLSPISFYSARGFGIDYFYRIPKINHEKTLILFNEPPKYELETSTGDAVKFILAITESCIDESEIIFINEGIIGYQKTIYLNKDNFKILFFNDKEQKITSLKSEMSLPTKGLKKYEDNFSIISESDCKTFDTSNIDQLKLDPYLLTEELAYDRKYNYFKGYIYGLSTGLIASKTKEEIQIKRSLQEITNRFAEFKNRTEMSSKAKPVKSVKATWTQSTSVIDYEKKLKNAISAAENLFGELYPGEQFSEIKLVAFLQKKFGNRLRTLDEAQKYVDYAILDEEILDRSSFSKLKSFFIKNNSTGNPIYRFEVLKEQIIKFSKGSGPDSNKDAANEIFKKNLFELEKIVDEMFLKKTSSGEIDLSGIQFNYEKNEVVVKEGFQSLNKELTSEFTLISNSILRNTKFGRGEAKRESILAIVEQIGSVFSKNKGARATQLYQYLNNEINEYSMDKVSSVVMRNFVAFAFNPDSIEKLDSFIEAKEIDHKWMAYSFWCAFNGFANTSRNLVKPIFDTDNTYLQNYLDNYLQSQFSNPTEFKKGDNKSSSATIVGPAKQDTLNQETIQNKSMEFFQKFIAPKYTIQFEDFFQILCIKNKETAIKELKEKGGIPKKDGKKLVDAYQELINASILF